MTVFFPSAVGLRSWTRQLERNRISLVGTMSRRFAMLPHEALLRPVEPFTGRQPESRSAEKRASNTSTGLSLVSLQFREAPTVNEVVTDLSECLRLCHRKRIEWLEPTTSQYTEWLEYGHNYLVYPILQLFRQLRVNEIKDDMYSHAEQDEDGILKICFTSLDFDTWEDPVHPPIVFITPQPFQDLINTETIASAISPILGHISSDSITRAIFTDLKAVIIIHPQAEGSKQVREVEVVPLKDDLRAFRIIVAAYLLRSMPQSTYLNPPTEPTGKYLFWLPPRRYDGDDKMRSDEPVFLTKHRHSDFDILKLIENREAALQFFRWKRFMEKDVTPTITSAGDILECATHEFDQRYHPPRGSCSKLIPASTLQHMLNILRPNPLNSMLSLALNNSKHFTIKLGKALGKPDLDFKHVFTRLHLCRIETIDERPVENCPELVMKVFDDQDRFMEILGNPYDENGILEDNQKDIETYLWFQGVLTAEWHVRGELTAFEKMQIAQGSLIPYFYGAHKFRLANGHEVYGVLMEYIDAPPSDSGILGKWTGEHRAQLMTSIRHALRVMQCSDISQHDWHAGQILCNLSHSSSPPQAHTVFIDFSATMQTLDLNIDLSKDDYGRCISAITHQDITGIDPKWVCEYWDRDEMKRECWDTYSMALFEQGFVWDSRAVDPYKFVYERLD